MISSTNPSQGFLISPQNRALLSASLLSNYMQISTASSLLTVSLFKSPQLPSLLRTLKSRLITNFSLLTSSFEKWNIKYLPTTAGFHVFAKLVPDAKTWEDEKEVVDRLLQGGVFVVAGRGFGGVNGEIGWIRVAFSVEEEDLREGLRMIGIILGLEKEIV
jgi:aspartate/methionine/tyrosine aminotransferase